MSASVIEQLRLDLVQAETELVLIEKSYSGVAANRNRLRARLALLEVSDGLLDYGAVLVSTPEIVDSTHPFIAAMIGITVLPFNTALRIMHATSVEPTRYTSGYIEVTLSNARNEYAIKLSQSVMRIYAAMHTAGTGIV